MHLGVPRGGIHHACSCSACTGSRAHAPAHLEMRDRVLQGLLRALCLLLGARIGVVVLRLRLARHSRLLACLERLTLRLPVCQQLIFPPLHASKSKQRAGVSEVLARAHTLFCGTRARCRVEHIGAQAAHACLHPYTPRHSPLMHCATAQRRHAITPAQACMRTGASR